MSIPNGFRQQVTLYRKLPQGYHRRALTGCYLEYSQAVDYDQEGRQVTKPFLLILPAGDPVQADDLVYAGLGPVAPGPEFVPANEPRLLQVQYVTAYPTHTEAGRKRSFR